MARAKRAVAADARAGKWKGKGNAPAPAPSEPGASREPFRFPEPIVCPKCGASLGFADDAKTAKREALRAIKEGTHSPVYCERAKNGTLPEPVIPKPEKTKKATRRRPARKRR